MWQSIAEYKSASQHQAPAKSAPAATLNPEPPTPPEQVATPHVKTPPPPEPAVLPDQLFPEPPARDPNRAVKRCCSAYHHAYTASRAAGDRPTDAEDKANAAYIKEMPYLTSPESIADFVACVGHGMIIGVFWHDKGPKLLGAAKTALAALPRLPGKPGRPIKKPLDP